MTIHQPIHQCPKCELRFSWQTELDDHCRDEHPGFRHEYPAHATPEPPPPPGDPGRPAAGSAGAAGSAAGAAARRARESRRTSTIVATWWSER